MSTAPDASQRRSTNRTRAGYALVLGWIALQVLGWFLPGTGLGLFLLEPITITTLVLILAFLLLLKPSMTGDFLFVACIIICLWRIILDMFGPETGIFDDAFMFTRYARNLVNLGRIAWNPDGIPTYGLTSPLYLIVVTPVQLLLPTADPEITIALASRLSGLGFILTLFAMLWQFLSCGRGEKQVIIALVPNARVGIHGGSQRRSAWTRHLHCGSHSDFLAANRFIVTNERAPDSGCIFGGLLFLGAS